MTILDGVGPFSRVPVSVCEPEPARGRAVPASDQLPRIFPAVLAVCQPSPPWWREHRIGRSNLIHLFSGKWDPIKPNLF